METTFSFKKAVVISFVVCFAVGYTHTNFLLSLCPTPEEDGDGLYALAACCSTNGAVQCDPYE